MEASLAATYPQLGRLVSEVLSIWPEHGRIIDRSLAGRDPDLMVHSERLSGLIIQLVGQDSANLGQLAQDYRFLCEKIITPEEWHFRRHGTYRLQKFEDALAQIYSNEPFMARYMNGLLLSTIFWVNHTNASHHYVTKFLPGLSAGADLLEVGPGHGFLMYLASAESKAATLTGWDVSQASLNSTRHALERMQIKHPVHLERRDIFSDAEEGTFEPRFDAIVLSEVLEHLEKPVDALRRLLALLRPGGKIWINVPVNSPAPDHIFLLRSPSEAAEVAREAGFDVVEHESFPTAGVTLEKAIKQTLTISCVVIGQRRA